MGNLFRLAVFILALGALAAGTGLMLLKERQREQALERLLLTTPAAAGEIPATKTELLVQMRDQHGRSQRLSLFFGGLAMACVIIMASIPARPSRPAPERDRGEARSEMRGIETLARANVAQRVELDHEREARHRSEQDLHLQQVLANHALQDKVNLGRDLHDGLVQTLYATGLVLETAGQRLAQTPSDPAEAGRLLERAKTTLNAAIREARGTIGGLTPDALDEQSLGEAIRAILDHLDGGRLECCEIALDPELPAMEPRVRTELLQIIRESASNALRHGGASRLDIACAPLPDGRLKLTVIDNGRGFDPAAATRGHGLDNLAARARNLAATLDLDSAPGRGATVTLILPAARDL